MMSRSGTDDEYLNADADKNETLAAHCEVEGSVPKRGQHWLKDKAPIAPSSTSNDWRAREQELGEGSPSYRGWLGRRARD